MGDRLGLAIANMDKKRVITNPPTTFATESYYFFQRLDWAILGQSAMDKTCSPSKLKRELVEFSPIPGK